MQILNNNPTSYENFISACHSKATAQTYSKCLKNYAQFHHVENYDELLQFDKQTTANMIMRFVLHQRNVKQNSLSRITVYFSSIRLFYEMNYYEELNWSRLARYKGRERAVVVYDRTYTKEEIQKMLQFSDLRMKVCILVMLSSGVRTGGLAGLKLRDLRYIEDYKLYQITVYSDTPSESYYTFCTPECAQYIKMYLDSRQNQFGETLTPDSPLIRQKFDSTNKIEMSAEDIQERVRYLLQKSNVLTPSNHPGRNSVMRCHGLRKYFDTVCIDSDMKHIPKELLMGHKVSLGMDRHYYRPTSDKLLNEYIKVVDELTINDENRLLLENTQLKQKQKAQELRLSSLEEKFEEWVIKSNI